MVLSQHLPEENQKIILIPDGWRHGRRSSQALPLLLVQFPLQESLRYDRNHFEVTFLTICTCRKVITPACWQQFKESAALHLHLHIYIRIF